MKKVFNAKKALSIVLSLAMILSLFVFAPTASAATVNMTEDNLVATLDFDTVAPKTTRQTGVSYTALRNYKDNDCYLYVDASEDDEQLSIGSLLMGLLVPGFSLSNGVSYNVSFDYYLLAKPASGNALSIDFGNTGDHAIAANSWDLRQWYTSQYTITGKGDKSIDITVNEGTNVIFDNIKVMQGENEIARLTFDSESYEQISSLNPAFQRVTGDELDVMFGSNKSLHITSAGKTNPFKMVMKFDGLGDVDFGDNAAIFMSCDITVVRQADPQPKTGGQEGFDYNDLNFRVLEVGNDDAGAASTTGGQLWDWMWLEDCGPNSGKPLLENEFELGVPNHLVKQFGIPANRVDGLALYVYPGFEGYIDNINIYKMNTLPESVVASYDFDHPGASISYYGNESCFNISDEDASDFAFYTNGTNGVLDIDSNTPDGQTDTYFKFPNDFSDVHLDPNTEYMVSFDYMNARDNNKNDWCFAVIVENNYNEPKVFCATDTDSSYTDKECPVGFWKHTAVRFTTELSDPKFQLQVSGDGEMLFDNFNIYEVAATGAPALEAKARWEGDEQYVDVTYSTSKAGTEFNYDLAYDEENLTYTGTTLSDNLEDLVVTEASADVEKTYKIIDTRSYSGPDYYHEAITYQLKNGFEYNDSYDDPSDYSKATHVVMTYRVLEGTPRDNFGLWNNDPTDGAYSQVTSGINSGNWMQLDDSGAWATAEMQCHHTPKQADGNFFMTRVPTGLVIEIKSIELHDGFSADGQIVGLADIEATTESQEAVPTDYRGMIIDTKNYTGGIWDHVEIPYEMTGDFDYKETYDGPGDYWETFAVMTYRVNSGTPLDRCSIANNCGFKADGYSLAEGSNTGALFNLICDGQIHKHGVQYHHTPKRDQNYFMIAVPKGVELEIMSIEVYRGWMSHNNVYVYDDDPDNYNIGTNSPVGVANIDLIPLYGEDHLPQLTIDATEANAAKRVYFDVPAGYTFTNTTGASQSSCPNGLALHFKVRYFGETTDNNGNHLDIRLNGGNYYPAQNYKKIVADEGEWANVYVQTHSTPPSDDPNGNFIEITGFKGCKYDFKYVGVCTEWLDASGNLVTPEEEIPDNHYFDRQYFAGELADPTEITTGGEGINVSCKANTNMKVAGEIATMSFKVANGYTGELTFTVTDDLGATATVTVNVNSNLNAAGVIARYDENDNKTGIAFGQIVVSDDVGPYYEDENGEIYDITDIGFVVALDKHVDGELTVDTVDPYVQNISVFDCEPESVSGDEVLSNTYSLQISDIADADEAITAVPYIVIDDGKDTVIYGQTLTSTMNDATATWQIP